MSEVEMRKESQGRKFKVSLGVQDSKSLKDIADALGISESEVVRKGLQLMALYQKTKEDETGESALVLKEGEKNRELMIL